MFFLLPTTVDSDRSIAPVATQIRWWESVRTTLMEDWKKEHLIEWDAPTKDAGGASHTVWFHQLCSCLWPSFQTCFFWTKSQHLCDIDWACFLRVHAPYLGHFKFPDDLPCHRALPVMLHPFFVPYCPITCCPSQHTICCQDVLPLPCSSNPRQLPATLFCSCPQRWHCVHWFWTFRWIGSPIHGFPTSLVVLDLSSAASGPLLSSGLDWILSYAPILFEYLLCLFCLPFLFPLQLMTLASSPEHSAPHVKPRPCSPPKHGCRFHHTSACA